MSQAHPFVFIESNTTGSGRLFIETSADSGWEPIVFARDPGRYPFLDEIMVKRTRADTSDPAEVAAALERLSPAAVFSSSDRGVELAAQLARKLGLFGADPKAIQTCQDKSRLYAALHAAGLEIPKTLIAKSEAAVEAAVRDLGAPVVLKPIVGTGSIDVRLCRDRLEAIAQFRVIERDPRGGGVLVQEFVQGSEHSVECVGTGTEIIILAVVDKHLGDQPFFVEIAHDLPSSLPELKIDRVEVAATRALAAVGFDAGGAHVEMKVSGDRIVIIEINPRPAGGMIPVLMEHALGIPIVRNLVALYSGGTPNWQRRKHDASSIGFMLPPCTGKLRGVDGLETAWSIPGIVDVAMYCRRGDRVGRQGDFSDRIGHVISVSSDATEAQRTRDAAIAAVMPRVTPVQDVASTFQLRSSVLNIAQPILEPAKARQILSHLFDIEEAHCLCLHDAGLLMSDSILTIVTALDEQRRRRFIDVLAQPMDRGLYLAYETWLIDLLGVEIGGSVHAGRSRNDINATLAMIDTRLWTTAILRRIWKLRRVLLDHAADNKVTPFVMFSQYQPGLPSFAGHYFQAIEQALARHASLFFKAFELADCCPMGAAAGGGTTLPINPRVTASYLGFGSTAGNSLDAVASRDAVIHLLALGAALGTTVSRIMQDLQVWSTPAYGLVSIADDLVGGSSMMPQKRNPYLLELARAKASQIGGALQMILSAVAKTPFSNSLEVSTTGMHPATPAVDALLDVLTLTTEIVTTLCINSDQVAKMTADEGILSTAFAERRVREDKLPFRMAYEEAVCFLREPGIRKQASGSGDSISEWAQLFAQGGGPGDESLLQEARDRLDRDGQRLRAKVCLWHNASRARRDALDQLRTDADHRPKGD
ncbi:MAG: lyase family protein [Pseudomonadota bacterium]